MSVADLLQQSHAAHLRYREALSRRVPQGDTTVAVPGNSDAAGIALVDACRLRVEAHALDPDLTDSAWRDEAVTHDHDALLAFYADQLSR